MYIRETAIALVFKKKKEENLIHTRNKFCILYTVTQAHNSRFALVMYT